MATRFLIVQTDYEYNDETYDVRDGYSAVGIASSREEAYRFVEEKNRLELANWDDVEQIVAFYTTAQRRQFESFLAARYPNVLTRTKYLYSTQYIVSIDYDELPLSIIHESGIYPSFFKVIEVPEL